MSVSPSTLTDPGQGLLCPTCRVPLVMTDRQNVEIDYCPKCRGVWLDRGELDKIIERSLFTAAADVPPRPQSAPPYEQERSNAAGDPRHGRGHDGGGKHGSYGHGSGGHGSSGYGRKSWLSEIFD